MDNTPSVCDPRVAEFFLKRHMFKRASNGRVIHSHFARLRFPNYWHEDILFALKVMMEAGFIDDARCDDALDLLERKQLRQGGWAAQGKYYRATRQKIPYGHSLADWGAVSQSKRNDFVTADALRALCAAGRYAL